MAEPEFLGAPRKRKNMAGFFLLHWTQDTDPSMVARVKEDALARLVQSHPSAVDPVISVVDEEMLWCARLDTKGSPSTALFRDPRNHSWIFIAGPAAVDGKRPGPSRMWRASPC